MDRNYLKTGFLNSLALLVAAVGAAVAARSIDSDAAWCGSLILGSGLLISLVSWFQMCLGAREQAERLEYDELIRGKGAGGGAALFEGGEETFPARRSREIFERWFVPVFTLLLVAGQAAGIYWRWKLITDTKIQPENATLAMALFGFFSLALFLLGKYSSGLARLDKQRLLRPGSGFLLLGAYVSFAIAAALGAVQGGFAQWDDYIARAFCVVLGLVAVETLFGLVFEIYRPRTKGEQARLLYDSRLVGLLGQPEGIIRTAAHAVDYQFGFKVSETWFFQFVARRFVVLFIAQLAALLLSTSVIIVGPGEQALLERFGSYVQSRGVLGPGAHFKLPWPVDTARRYATKEVQSFSIGFVPADKEETEQNFFWTVSHYKEEYNLLVANRAELMANTNNAAGVPVSLLTVSIPVQYQISDVEKWAYKYANSGELLEKIATREVVRYLVGVDLNDVMSTGRVRAADELRQHVQAQADALNLGAQVIFVGLQGIHPPVKIAEEYEKVVGAQQTRRGKILAAEGYAAKSIPMSQANASKQVFEAEADAARRQMDAMSKAFQFTNQATAFAAAPRVYPQMLYLQTAGRAMQGSRKYLLSATNTRDVIQLNLEDKIRVGLETDPQLPGSKIK